MGDDIKIYDDSMKSEIGNADGEPIRRRCTRTWDSPDRNEVMEA